MSSIPTEIITFIVTLIFGRMWYSEFIKRRKAEADLAVLHARKNLDAIDKMLAENPTLFEPKFPDVPVSLRTEPRTFAEQGDIDPDYRGDDASTKRGPEDSGSGL